jgi:ABC-2 type transport system permease protein
MNKILAVARWEYVEKVKSKAFLIGLFLTPLIMVGMGVLPSLLATQEDKTSKAIGVIDESGQLAAAFAERMQTRYLLSDGRPNYVVMPIEQVPGAPPEEAIGEADRRVASGDIEGYCIVKGMGTADTVVEYRTRAVGDFMLGARIEEALRGIITERRARERGVEPQLLKELQVKLDLKTVKISKTGEKEDSGFLMVFFSAYVFMMMLFFLIVTSGQVLVRSVLEEKSNRIVEVLVSSCSPTQLMAGKVLGLSGLGFTQIGFWALIGVAATAQFGLNIVPPVNALLLIVYFVLGYLFYAAVFIGAGSPLTTEQAAQQVTSYLVLLLVIPIVLALPAMKNPDATWIKVLTFIPLLTPTMMALRIPIQMPQLWEIVLTIVIMLLSIYFGMVAAGRIFRVGILMTGKAPGLGEIFRWIRKG